MSANQGMALFNLLKAAKNKSGKITIEDLTAISAQIMAQAKSMKSPDGKEMSAGDILNNVAEANAELAEVVSHTEGAVNAIMDAADIIQKCAAKISIPKLSELITKATAKIYEDCNFQDVTGQRINKSIKILTNVELALSGGAPVSNAAIKTIEANVDGTYNEADLLNGPGRGEVPSQEEIDKLFANM